MATIMVRRPRGLILESAAGTLESVLAGMETAGAVDAVAQAEIQVEDDLSEGDRDALEASPEWITADSMPLKLIEPVAAAASEDGEEGGGADAGSDPAAAPNPFIDTSAGAAAAWGIVATGAAQSPFDGSGVPVAVLDTGIDPAHPAFAGVNIVRKNFTDDGDEDTNGHGTHCAGTIFGRDVEGLRIGVARGVTKALIGKVIPGGTDALVRALNWASDNGARVASMSLAFDFYAMMKRLRDQALFPEAAAMSQALRNFRNNITIMDLLVAQFRVRGLDGGGMLVVAATGNESLRKPPPGKTKYTVAAASPSSAMGILAVGAVGKAAGGLEIASFSNTNPQVVAPGVGVLSAMSGSQSLTPMNGTSMATPHVAGLAALHWQAAAQGGASAELVAARLVGLAATQALAPGSKPVDVGSGMVRAPT